MGITVYEYRGSGIRVVRGDHSISGDSGIPIAVRAYSNRNQAIAAERGEIRNLILLLG